MDTEKLLKLSSAFSPRVPIDSRSLFCGRINQISQLMEIVGERGLHGILFGERGVGKTSLVYILNELLNEVIGKSFVLHIPCNTVPSFDEIARHVANKLTFFRRTKRVGFSSDDTVEQIDLSSMLSDEPTVAEVGEILALLKPPAVIVLDEFDRIRNSDDRTKIANLVKSLSDKSAGVTLVLVGVAHDVLELIGHHPSIERCLRQVRMPIMSPEELKEIIDKGLAILQMTIHDHVEDVIIESSAGFPHFTHLLARNCAKSAISEDSNHIDVGHFTASLDLAMQDIQESLRNAYEQATLSTKPTMFKEVLLACALAPLDEHGTFQAKDLESALGKILKRSVKLTDYVYHLGKLSSGERGNIFEKIGTEKRHRYRFTNPLMRPYIRLEAQRAGINGSITNGEQLVLWET